MQLSKDILNLFPGGLNFLVLIFNIFVANGVKVFLADHHSAAVDCDILHGRDTGQLAVKLAGVAVSFRNQLTDAGAVILNQIIFFHVIAEAVVYT